MNRRFANRFTVAEAWIKRKHQFAPDDQSECSYCERRVIKKYAYGKLLSQKNIRITSKRSCQKSAKHFARIFGLGPYSNVVHAAAFVLYNIDREMLQPFEPEIERTLLARERLSSWRNTDEQRQRPPGSNLTGRELLRVVRQVMKAAERKP